MDPKPLLELTQIAITTIAVVFAIFSVLGAFRSGALTKIRLGSLEISAEDKNTSNDLRAAIAGSGAQAEKLPFEVEQLTSYYSQILSQSKISFWFSLVFASLGFVAILLAAFLYNPTSNAGTVAQFIAGIIMEAVSSLFFIQSKNAQKSMGEFFDKLRSDRLHLESRKMCEAIANDQMKDSLKLTLALHYAGVPNSDEIVKSAPRQG